MSLELFLGLIGGLEEIFVLEKDRRFSDEEER